MFGNTDLLKILELIQGFVPKVELTGIGIKELKVELANNHNTYNSININIGTIGIHNEPLAIVTPVKLTGDIGESIAFLPKNIPRNSGQGSEKKLKLDIQSIPFSSGFHLVINQKDWWKKQEDREDKAVLIGSIKLIPICKNDWLYIKTIESEHRFGFGIHNNGDEYVQIWADGSRKIRPDNLPSNLLKLFSFKKYKSGEIITVDCFPELVISLEKSVVEKAILVEYKPEEFPSEYFIFILAQE